MQVMHRCALIAGILVAGLIVAPAASGRTKQAGQASKVKPSANAPKPVVAVFTFDRPITEKPVAEDLLFGPTGSESMQHLLARMKKVRDDRAVKAVVLLWGGTSLGTAQIEEVRAVMDEIKAAGKKIYVHADGLSTRNFVLLSGASKLSVVPTGSVIITGIYGEQLYLRGLLDKIAVIPDFLTCGKYKSAAEVFMRDGPSPQAAEMIGWLFDSIYQTYVDLIARGRGVPPEKVRTWIDRGLYTAEQARAAGIIDATQYRHDFVSELKKQIGQDVTFDKRYGKKKRTDIDFSSPFGMLKFWGDLLRGAQAGKARKKTIAVIYVDGPIVPGKPGPSLFPSQGIAYSTPIRKALDKAAGDDSIKGVVLRVSSPGGSAVASEIILSATRRVQNKKPLAVSMGSVAGSGGYYVACGAAKIFADRATLTGSIGVVGGKLATADMWDKVGVRWQPIRRGKNAALFSSMAPFTPAEREQFQSWMNAVYDVFKGHVKAYRGKRLRKPIDQIAGGRVFTGAQALDLGLIDRIGGLEAAIADVADRAGLKQTEYTIRILPRPKNLLELLLSDLGNGRDEDNRSLFQGVTAAGLAAGSPLLPAVFAPAGTPVARLQAIRRALRQLRTLRAEQVVLMMPEIIVRD